MKGKRKIIMLISTDSDQELCAIIRDINMEISCCWNNIEIEGILELNMMREEILMSDYNRTQEAIDRMYCIIRCKDCKHHQDEEPGMVYCPNMIGGWVDNNFFCGWAERKENEE